MEGSSSKNPQTQQEEGDKKEEKIGRKRARVPDSDENSVDVPELPPVVNLAAARKVRRTKQTMKLRSSDSSIVKEKAAETEQLKCASDVDDQTGTMPPSSVKESEVVPTVSGKRQAQAAKEKKTSSIQPKKVSKFESKSGKGKQKKAGKKRQLEAYDEVDSAEPPMKKIKLADKLRRELLEAVKSISSNTKEALKNPGKLAKEVNMYSKEFITDIKDIKTDFIDGAKKFADIMLQPTSHEKLVESEKVILKDVQENYRIQDVELQCDTKIIIHTACFDSQNVPKDSKEEKLPLVLLHGYGGGLPVFYRNFSSLSRDRNVYALDLPGFALSSRVKFSESPDECRDEIVQLLEKWREAMKLEKFILLGHSFGGYLSASYTLKFYSRVRHLILADPWGILDKEEDKREFSTGVKLTALLNLNPFELVRKAMHIGRFLHDKFVPERIRKAYGDKLVQYFYHSNAQIDATGEEAFACISNNYFWPHAPMKPALMELDPSVSITFLYGKESPYKNDGGMDIKRKRCNVFVPEPIEAGHHIQAEEYEDFNQKVSDICDMVDGNTDFCDKGK